MMRDDVKDFLNSTAIELVFNGKNSGMILSLLLSAAILWFCVVPTLNTVTKIPEQLVMVNQNLKEMNRSIEGLNNQIASCVSEARR